MRAQVGGSLLPIVGQGWGELDWLLPALAMTHSQHCRQSGANQLMAALCSPSSPPSHPFSPLHLPSLFTL